MEELIVYDADVTEVLDLLATFYDDLLWWEDLEVYQNWDEVNIESPTQVTDDIMKLLFDNGYEVDIY